MAHNDQEVSTTYGSRMDNKLSNLKASLASWKECMLLVNDVILWKEIYYSYIIGVAVTALFLYWWWMEITVITTLAVILFFIALADYCLPGIAPKLRKGKAWDGTDEERYTIACQQLLDVQDKMAGYWNYVQDQRENHSKMYIASVSGSLFLLGLLGYSVDNTFLLYLLVLGLSLFPGAYHRGIIQRYYGKACQQVQMLLARVKSKPKDE